MLKTKKAFITISKEYSDFANIFSEKLTAVLAKNTKINIYIINLEKKKQLLYELIYSLRLIELKTLKNYIKSDLANSFIQAFKSLFYVFILFDQTPDRNFQLCVNY